MIIIAWFITIFDDTTVFPIKGEVNFGFSCGYENYIISGQNAEFPAALFCMLAFSYYTPYRLIVINSRTKCTLTKDVFLHQMWPEVVLENFRKARLFRVKLTQGLWHMYGS